MRDDNDWDDDDPEDPDWPDDDYEEADTFPCPNCGAEVFEDSPCCAVCGEYVTAPAVTGWKTKPWWYIALVLAGILATMVALVGMG